MNEENKTQEEIKSYTKYFPYLLGIVLWLSLMAFLGTIRNTDTIYTLNDLKENSAMPVFCTEFVNTYDILCDGKVPTAFSLYNRTSENIEMSLNKCENPRVIKSSVCIGERVMVQKINESFKIS